jgi:hypothetical protein
MLHHNILSTSSSSAITDREFAQLIDHYEEKYLAERDYTERLKWHRNPLEVKHDILRQLDSDIVRFQQRSDMRDFDPARNSEAPVTSRINEILRSDKRLRTLPNGIRRFCALRSKDLNEMAGPIAEYRAMNRLYRRINRSVMRRQFLKTGPYRIIAAPKQGNAMSESDRAGKPITALISYSWDNEPHKVWVLGLANKLRTEGGVNVLLDRYELTAGRQITHFMERSVAKADKVILIMTPDYKEKADGRKGGVGFECSMISQQIYENQDSRKFIPVVRNGSFKDSSPAFMKPYLAHDMTEDATFEDGFMALLRLVYDEPGITPPPLGKKPDLQARC